MIGCRQDDHLKGVVLRQARATEEEVLSSSKQNVSQNVVI